MQKDSRIEKVLNQLIKYCAGDFSVRTETSDRGDEIDAIIIGLNTLGDEQQNSGRAVRDYEKRVNSLMQVLLRHTLFDFSQKAEVSAAGDELDAVAIGLNTLAEELQAAREKEEKQLQATAEAHHFLDTILENIPNMVFVKDAKHLRFVRLNKAGLELLGMDKQNIIGKDAYDIYPKEIADQLTTSQREAIQKKAVTEIPEQALQTSRGIRIMRSKLIPIVENGEAHYLLGIHEDITDFKRNEKALTESKIQLETIIANAPSGVIVMERGGSVMNWNRKSEEIFGYSAAEAINAKMSDLIMPPRFLKAHNEGMSRYLKTGEGPILNKIVEITALRKSGEEFPIELGISAIRLGDKHLFVAFINDITVRKRMEAELKLSEERIRRIVENVRDYAIFMIDPHGYLLNWNRGAEMIIGYRADEIIGKHFSIFYTEEDKQNGRPQRNLTEATEQGRSEDEGWRMKKDGSLFWADVIFTAIHDETGALKGFSKITRDITEKKAAEEQVKKLNRELQQNIKLLENVNSELEAFTYSVSHDLRAPLRAISGYIKIIEEDYGAKMEEDALTMMHSVRNNAKKMGQLIDDLLSLSRLGRKTLEKREADMNEIAKRALEEVMRIPRNPNTKVTINSLPRALADEALIHQVFVNLLSNAVKYSSKKEGPEVVVGGKETPEEMVYYISDNGTGFDMKYYDKLFGIFQRLHDAGEFEGTGVGLALVKRIVTRHSGRVWAESEPGKGATFYFSLPKT